MIYNHLFHLKHTLLVHKQFSKLVCVHRTSSVRACTSSLLCLQHIEECSMHERTMDVVATIMHIL